MSQLADIKDINTALIAASRFGAQASDISSVGTNGLNLVAQTEAACDFGEDEVGRRYRKNYSEAAQELGKMIQLFCDGVAQIGVSANQLLNTVVEADDPRGLGA
ncbi:hypothetical protein GCM10027290_52600 [Micromonospora sonneratiae]|uniref:Excreted virulence factor EspC, type VII ESX diderm n=1 Tax=Micromonospora sonneratiae TaxID=1184706 RepID=A0ABW3YBJ4_9ACTN